MTMADVDRLAVHIAAGEIAVIAKRIEAQVELRRHNSAAALQHWSGPNADSFRRQCERQYREGRLLVDGLRTIAKHAIASLAP